MEEVLSALQDPPEPLRRGTPLPLSQLLEDSRSTAKVPNHLLDSKIYTKVKDNSLIHAEPPELHFSGFVLGSDYLKSLKLINNSSSVMNIHIIPTQTKHFQTSYTKKHRLVPGLAYTVNIQFCPDEWRYFYDCVRVHCEGEENLLVPVHAYPVIDDLHIPSRIDLAAVPLGQSVTRTIPLSCSCPVEFEFQVNVLQAHDAFDIRPLIGVIPANGQVDITVTFTPSQYDTSQVTIQLVVSQFNTKPYLCTITGNCTPHLALSHMQRKLGQGDGLSAECKRTSLAVRLPQPSRTRRRPTEDGVKTKVARDQTGLKRLEDACTPAGVAKMLIRDGDKKDVASRRQLKEALFVKKIQDHVKNEKTNRLRWQVHLGSEAVSGPSRRQILEDREAALHQCRGDDQREDTFAVRQVRLSNRRLLCEAGQTCRGAPSFQFYSSFQLELKQKALRCFQQAARKFVLQHRMRRRLAALKSSRVQGPSSPRKAEEETTGQTPDRVLPPQPPSFFDEVDTLFPDEPLALPDKPIDVIVTAQIPVFELQVPQYYKLMGYQPVSVWEAFEAYVPTALPRPLRAGASPQPGEDQQLVDEDGGAEEAGVTFPFSVPDALLSSVPAHPLRIFNPAPGLQPHKPAPKYLEGDLEFHLCPLPRYTCGVRTQSPRTQRTFLGGKEAIKGVMTWKNFDSITSKCLSNRAARTGDLPLLRWTGTPPQHPGYTEARLQTGNCSGHDTCCQQDGYEGTRLACVDLSLLLSFLWYLIRCVHYITDTLPLEAPPPLTELPADLAALSDHQCEGSGLHLTPQMIRAEFLSALPTRQGGSETASEKETCTSDFNQMGKRVMSNVKHLGATDGESHSS